MGNFAKKVRKNQMFNLNNGTIIGRELSLGTIKSISEDGGFPQTGLSHQEVFNIMYSAGLACLTNKFFKEYRYSIKNGQMITFGLTENNNDFWIKFFVLKENGCFGIKHVELDVASFEKYGYSYDDCIKASEFFSNMVYLEMNPATGNIENVKNFSFSA